MAAAVEKTAQNTGLILNIAVAYGGRWDIANAARTLARKAVAGEIDADAIDADLLSGELQLAGLPDPDLLIRTGGEQRISNFLLWQSAYTELYFTQVLWPDFDAAALDAAIADFNSRERRFGRTSRQVRDLKHA